MIGVKFRLKRAMLGNPAGTMGYVFNDYKDFEEDGWRGVQIIFPNGNYDGFSFEEQGLYLEEDGFSKEHENYQFQNVMQVSRDFRNGYWDFSE